MSDGLVAAGQLFNLSCSCLPVEARGMVYPWYTHGLMNSLTVYEI